MVKAERRARVLISAARITSPATQPNDEQARSKQLSPQPLRWTYTVVLRASTAVRAARSRLSGLLLSFTSLSRARPSVDTHTVIFIFDSSRCSACARLCDAVGVQTPHDNPPLQPRASRVGNSYSER